MGDWCRQNPWQATILGVSFMVFLLVWSGALRIQWRSKK